MWYLQFQDECAKLFASIDIRKPPVCLNLCELQTYFNTGGFSKQRFNQTNPRLSGGFLIQKMLYVFFRTNTYNKIIFNKMLKGIIFFIS